MIQEMTRDGGIVGGWYDEAAPPVPPAGGEVPSPGIEIEIDGAKQVLTRDDVINLKRQQASATQKTQQVASIIKAIERYGVDADTYLQRSEASMAVLHDLMERGVVNENLEFVGPPPASTPPVLPPPPPGSSPPPPPVAPLPGAVDSKLDVIERALGAIHGKIESLEKDQTTMVRLRLEERILGKHPDLTPEDVSRIFVAAQRDRNKPLLQHADELATEKKTTVAKMELEWAKKYGVNPEEFKRNQLIEQDAAGGASILVQGKKLSFKAKPGDKATTTPKQAMLEFFRRRK